METRVDRFNSENRCGLPGRKHRSRRRRRPRVVIRRQDVKDCNHMNTKLNDSGVGDGCLQHITLSSSESHSNNDSQQMLREF